MKARIILETILFFAVVAIVATIITSLNTKPINKPKGTNQDMNNSTVTGGVTDQSFRAPKEITSIEITYFHTYFYKNDKLDYDNESRYYEYEIAAGEDGEYRLEEKKAYNIGCTITAAELLGLDQILKEYDAAKNNGTDRITAGLPPEFDEMLLKVDYKSGESLYIHENSDPDSEMTDRLVKYFKKIFVRNGYTQVLSKVDLQTYKSMEVSYYDGEKEDTYTLEDSNAIQKMVEKYRILDYVNWNSDLGSSKQKYINITLENTEGRAFYMHYEGDAIPTNLLDAVNDLK